ncbi:MAG TPA: hypothetical protein DIS88_06365 [Prevotella sp.]|nr:hypothetical protein [Prevotella sp.]
MNAQNTNDIHWSENVIIVDADYLDHVAFDLIVNFERMIGRKIPQADMAHWIDCIALDGGIREGDHETQVVLIHQKENLKLENFQPAKYEEELSGKAFRDNLGEFIISSYPVENVISKDDYIIDILNTVVAQKDVRRVMVIPNADKEEIYDQIRDALHYLEDDTKRITVFSMQPMQGGNFRQEILGYSLMSALGIKADEIK